ncbi:MAG: DUF3047 domain-containing protein [Pseudomonadota bacterium]
MISTQKYAVALLTLCVGFARADTTIIGFESMAPKSVPTDGWETREGSAEGIYRIEEENGTKFLHAEDHGQSVQLFRKKGWPIKKELFLTWSWRAHRFPAGADERVPGKNDSVAGIYVIWPRWWFVPQILKYVWSESAPAGTVIRRSKWYSILVVRSGGSPTGTWVKESRDVAADFKDSFGRPPPDPVAVGFLTDANDTKGVAEADYGEVVSVAAKPDQ